MIREISYVENGKIWLNGRRPRYPVKGSEGDKWMRAAKCIVFSPGMFLKGKQYLRLFTSKSLPLSHSTCSWGASKSYTQ